MKDFHVAPVEIAENDAEEQKEVHDKVDESPLERFRRISKQVASQSVSIKWNEVIRGATIEANSQIGRCKNRESFKNQQNLLKAMEQARKLIERAPLSPSPNHSYNYDVMDQTNQTLVQLLKNISDEINEISPGNTLKVGTSNNRSVTPLQSLNAQLQTLISKSPSPRPIFRPKASPMPALNLRTSSLEGILSSSPKSLSSASSPTPPKSRSETPPIAKASMMKTRSPTPDSSRSLDFVDNVRPIPVVEVSAEPSIHIDDKSPLKQSPGSPIRVFKRKAPTPAPTSMSVTRPASLKINKDQGMIPPPPSKDEMRPLQIPILSTTPATPLLQQKPLTLAVAESAEAVEMSPESLTAEAPELPTSSPPYEESPNPSVQMPPEAPKIASVTENIAEPAMIAATFQVSYSVTEKLIPSESSLTARSPSPACLRPGNKIEDVKTIKRQTRAGWL